MATGPTHPTGCGAESTSPCYRHLVPPPPWPLKLWLLCTHCAAQHRRPADHEQAEDTGPVLQEPSTNGPSLLWLPTEWVHLAQVRSDFSFMAHPTWVLPTYPELWRMWTVRCWLFWVSQHPEPSPALAWVPRDDWGHPFSLTAVVDWIMLSTLPTKSGIIFLVSKIIVDGDYSCRTKDACSLEGKLWQTYTAYSKAETSLCLQKSLESKPWFFCSHMKMWKLDHEEGWVQELILLNYGAGEDSWESLGVQGDQASQS